MEIFNTIKIERITWLRTGILLCILGTTSFISCKRSDVEKPLAENESSAQKPSSNAVTNATTVARKIVMHYNICGNNCYDQNKPGAILAKIDEHQPLIISFNEICYAQYRVLKDGLVSRGYTSTYITNDQRGYACNVGPYASNNIGNALFYKGTLPTTRTYYTLPIYAGSLSKPTLLYAEVTIDGKPTIISTTHITNDQTYHDQEIQFVADKAKDWINAGKAVILAGDFNSLPGDAIMGELYSHSGGTGLFQEADESEKCPGTRCRDGENTFKPTSTTPGVPKKLDYIFFSAAAFGYMEADAIYDPAVSDHSMCIGSAQFK